VLDRSAGTRFVRILLIPSVLVLVGLASFRVAGQEASDSDRVPIVLRARISALGARPRLALEGETFRASPDLACFYERRGFAPAWSNARGPLPAVDELLAALGAAGIDGLRSEDYRLAALRKVVDAVRIRPEALPRADLDLVLSNAFLSFAADLRHGKVNPEAIYSDCALAPDPTDLADVLEAALDANRIRAALADLAPPQKAYRLLRDALRRYRELALSGDPEPVPPGPTLRLGDRGERIAALRARLAQAAEADAAAPLPPATTPDLFDETLAEGVRRFQERHGLEEDGVAGRATLAELNQRAEDHVLQIEANLERWRWLPHDLGKRHVLVNIAAFHLDAVENGRAALEMRVIVGKPFTKTPMFSSAMNGVLLNPSWYVPQKIAVEEILPKAAKDPTYLRREGYEVLSATRLRQKPGPGNALGRIKFVFPNRFGVYLHDTPAPTLFGRTLRAFSHGCIRIEKPFDLAIWAFRGDPKWTPEAIQAGIDAGKEHLVPLPETLPVHVAYWTAWVGDDGVLRLGRDVYRRDAELIRRLHGSR
jgi:murein L,D-transpeptidase YcbB/YkuD